MEANLIDATYALVVVTALLVIATAIPVIQRYIEQRASRNARAARLVPDMNILKSRLEAGLQQWLSMQNVDRAAAERLENDADTSLGLLHKIVENSYDVSLKFANEIYVCRHLITCVYDEAQRFKASLDDTSDKARRAKDRRIERVVVLYKAASLTLDAGESLLPKRTTKVDRQTFWDRFSRVADERETAAAKALVDIRAERASRP